MISPKIRAAVIKRDSSTCQDCGHTGETGNRKGDIQVHHIEPERLGGSDDPNNLVALCVECHSVREVELRTTRPGRVSGSGKMNLTVQVTKGFADELDALVATITPRVSRSSVIETAILEWIANQQDTRKRHATPR